MRKTISGFTIVELLIVIVVIAILATISLVAYTGIQNRAHDSTIQNDLTNFKKALEINKVDKGIYTITDLTFRAAKGSYAITPTVPYNLVLCRSATYDQYTIVALSKSGTTFFVSSNSAVPRTSAATWDPSFPTTTCANVEPTVTVTNNYRGYASDDTTTGPWRVWAGGN